MREKERGWAWEITSGPEALDSWIPPSDLAQLLASLGHGNHGST